MRLNFDLIRAILLQVESTPPSRFTRFVSTDEESLEVSKFLGTPLSKQEPYQIELETKYTNEEILYHLNYCIKADLVESVEHTINAEYLISDLTVKGHEYLNMIRSPKVWNSIKEKIISTGVEFSFESVKNAATGIIQSLLN